MRGEGVGPLEEGPGGGLGVTPLSSNVPLSPAGGESGPCSD